MWMLTGSAKLEIQLKLVVAHQKSHAVALLSNIFIFSVRIVHVQSRTAFEWTNFRDAE